MAVSLISIFRNSTDYIDRYFEQIEALKQHLPVSVVVAEGDSGDETYERLERGWGLLDGLYKIDHGGPVFKSIDDPQRWGQVALVYNRLLDHLDPDGPVILVESDLIWEPETMVALLKHLGEGIDAVAPMSLKDDRFYDTWGHRWPDGEVFTSNIDQIVSDGKVLRPISSAGSCIAMKEDVARKARFGETDGIVGFCADLHRLGFHLYFDDQLVVRHP